MTLRKITITEKIQASTTNSAITVNRACFLAVCVPQDITYANKILYVYSQPDFESKFIKTTQKLWAAVKLFFLNFPEGVLGIFGYDATLAASASTGIIPINPGGNPPVTATTSPVVSSGIPPGRDAPPPTRADLESGLILLAKIAKNSSLHILSIPDFLDITAPADRTGLVRAAENLCKAGSNWLHFVNSGANILNAADAKTEAGSYVSELGHTSYFLGVGTEQNDVPVSIASVVCAIALKAQRNAPYSAPAGVLYPIVGLKDVKGYIDNDVEALDLESYGVNTLYNCYPFGLCVWASRTLAKNSNLYNINTRLAISVTDRRLQEAMLTMLFASSDPQGYTRNEILRRVVEVMERLFREGALSGATSTDAYRVVETDVTNTTIPVTPISSVVVPSGAATTPGAVTVPGQATPGTTPGQVTPGSTNNPIGSVVSGVAIAPTLPVNLRKILITVYCRFVQTVEEISIDLVAVDVFPNNL